MWGRAEEKEEEEEGGRREGEGLEPRGTEVQKNAVSRAYPSPGGRGEHKHASADAPHTSPKVRSHQGSWMNPAMATRSPPEDKKTRTESKRERRKSLERAPKRSKWHVSFPGCPDQALCMPWRRSWCIETRSAFAQHEPLQQYGIHEEKLLF